MEIKCKTEESMLITDMTPFQGNLKKRTEQDINELKDSLMNEGLLMPFAIWKSDKNYLLDGHGRRQAIMSLIDQDPSLLQVKWPVVIIEADDEDSARKALLQITSSYGKITKQGVKQFCVSIPDYKAPAIAKFVPKVQVLKDKNPKKDTRVILKIRVEQAKLAEVKEILGSVNYIEVL
ncbi:MAG: ParB N-terminal domain-containing protein [Pseudobutyrivibrio sp.]|nr:ParB N-terminal domain-containing protein [Pseudobutyrivibrio sp.]